MRQTRDTSERERYLSSFRTFEQSLNGKADTPLHQLRRQAIAQFAAQGFPTVQDEEWRYTNLAPLLHHPFQPALKSASLAEADLQPWLFAGPQSPRLVLVDGRYAPELSAPGSLPQGAKLLNLETALQQSPDLVLSCLNHQIDGEHHALAALNTAFLQDGAFLHLPEGAQVEHPIHLLFLSTAPALPAFSSPRLLVIAEARSRATLVETCAGPQGRVYLTNALAEVVVGEDASIEYCKIQQEGDAAFHLAHTRVRESCRSRFTAHTLSLGARLSRNQLDTLLDGEGVDSTLNGLYLAGGEQHVDHHTLIEHAQPRCSSHELYKGILGGRATGVFRGRIHVRPQAQKTDAYQANRNLLLSPEAQIDTKPQLEIYADDVKCSHGATVGQLDEEALFYLRTRGLDAAQAMGLLTRAFAGQLLERLSDEALREHLEQLVADKLAILGGGRP
ncbi:MAG: Fe-S cluster assembly protein SufD [Candidatus Latescibacteria bacterium]|nr:Fe-S cluster assembly protein SufD [Candidatus Latescibacterota bacterium]